MSNDRLSPLDASFLTIEDSVSHMHIGSVCIFEGPPPPQKKLVAMISSKLRLVPRYRQLVRPVPGRFSRPVWVDDPHFNIDYHVRRSALPSPGGEAELRRLVGRVMSQQLDRAKPLWEIWVVEGLEDGRWAMLCKTHHCLVDGVSGTELLAVVMDLSPDPSPVALDTWRPEAQPSSLRLLVDAVSDVASIPYRQLRALPGAALAGRDAVVRLAGLSGGALRLAGLLRPASPTSLNGPIGPHRRWAWASASVDDVKAVRHEVGGTFNDVVLAAITSGFRALLLHREEPLVAPLRTMVPVSVRPRDEAGKAIGDGRFNNKVSAMFADLPVHLADPVARLGAISAQMEDLKQAKEALAGEALTAISGFAPAMLLALGTRLVTQTALRNLNTVTTNVPGPQLPLYMRGRRLVKAFPFVPLAGQLRVTVAIFSYDGQVNFGVTGDYDSVPDLEILCSGIEQGLAELREPSARTGALSVNGRRHRR